MTGHPKLEGTGSLGSSLESKVSSLEESTSLLLEESSSSLLLVGGCLIGRRVVFLSNAGLKVLLPAERDCMRLCRGEEEARNP